MDASSNSIFGKRQDRSLFPSRRQDQASSSRQDQASSSGQDQASSSRQDRSLFPSRCSSAQDRTAAPFLGSGKEK